MTRCACWLMMLLYAGVGWAQRGREGATAADARNELAFGVRHVDANGSANGFSLTGVTVSSVRRVNGWFSLSGELAETRAGNISESGVNFSLLTYGIGPRVSLRRKGVEVFGETLFGLAHGSQSGGGSGSVGVTTRAIEATAGLSFRLTQRLSVRALQAGVLNTAFANGNGSQQHVIFGTGLVYRFNRPHRAERVVRLEPMNEIWFSCGTETATVRQGERLELLGHAMTQPEQVELAYAWGSEGGVVVGEGRKVWLDTSGMALGEHRLWGRASLVSSPETARECGFSFRVVAGGAAAETVALAQ